MHELTDATSYQTVRLKKGKHLSPEHGVCVMELASMLAGERFTDHPRSVSRVIAAFLRAYNDLVDESRRQDLYAYAAVSVGTHASRQVEERRAQVCLEWCEAVMPGSESGRWWTRLRPRTRSRRETIAMQTAELAAAEHTHESALALVDLLIALRDDDARSDEPARDPLSALPPDPDPVMTPTAIATGRTHADGTRWESGLRGQP